MKTFLPFIIILFQVQSIIACSCELPPSLCERLDRIDGQANELVFIGAYLQTDTIGDFQYAYKYKIDKLIRGTVILPGTPLDSGSAYENTDSTVWMLGGSGATCLYEYPDQEVLFALLYDSNYFGYVPNICDNDYFPIKDNLISGYIWEKDKMDILELSELEKLLDATCRSQTNELENYIKEQVSIGPNPSFETLQIKIHSVLAKPLTVKITDINGAVILQEFNLFDRAIIDLSHCRTGVYFLNYTREGHSYTQKLLKL